MTNPEPLSARIATLELAAGNLPELHTLRQVIVQEIRNQQISLADIDERIAEGQRAEIILIHLTDQTDRVLASGEILRGQQPDLPQSHEQDTHAEHVRLRRKVLEEQGFDQDTAAIIASHPEKYPSGPDVLAELAANQTPESPEVRKMTTSTEETASSAGGGQTQPELTNRQRLEHWIATLTPTDVVTVRDAASVTGMPEKSASTYLPQIMRAGLLERLPGTGTPGVPSQYRLPGSAAEPVLEQPEATDTPTVTHDNNDQPEPALTPEIDENDNNNPPPAEPADDQQQDEEPAAPATTTGHRPSKKARVLEVMQREPDRTWTVTILAIEADMDEDDVRYGLTNLQNQFLAHAVPGTSPREYRLGKAPETTAQPVSTSTLPPIPARLSTDECDVFDTLRKIPDGLTQRLLVSRLNWSTARTEKAVQALTRAGHIGHNGDRLRVIPPEMQDGAA